MTANLREAAGKVPRTVAGVETIGLTRDTYLLRRGGPRSVISTRQEP